MTYFFLYFYSRVAGINEASLPGKMADLGHAFAPPCCGEAALTLETGSGAHVSPQLRVELRAKTGGECGAGGSQSRERRGELCPHVRRVKEPHRRTACPHQRSLFTFSFSQPPFQVSYSLIINRLPEYGCFLTCWDL